MFETTPVWCDELNLIMSDIHILGRDSSAFTYVSDAHNTCSWLDHVVCSHSMHQYINDLKILDKFPSSDHLPVNVYFNVNLTATTDTNMRNSCSVDSNDTLLIFKWNDITDTQINDYRARSAKYMKGIHIPIHALACRDSSCDNTLHINDINMFYNDICNCLLRASTETIDSSKVTSHSDFIIPGWNDYVKTAHAEARQYYLLWRNSGKPHQGAAAELMRRSRLNFKYILRQCQSNEEMIRADAMARSLTD